MAEAHIYGEGTIRRSTPAWEELLEAIEAHRPGWHRDALCKEYPELSWFPERGQDVEAAKEVCRRCLVQSECRAVAVADGDVHGVWGGTSDRERRRMRAAEATTPRRRVCSWCGIAFYRAASPGGAKVCCGSVECRRRAKRESKERLKAKAG